jgi:hypothetical protein
MYRKFFGRAVCPLLASSLFSFAHELTAGKLLLHSIYRIQYHPKFETFAGDLGMWIR